MRIRAGDGYRVEIGAQRRVRGRDERGRRVTESGDVTARRVGGHGGRLGESAWVRGWRWGGVRARGWGLGVGVGVRDWG